MDDLLSIKEPRNNGESIPKKYYLRQILLGSVGLVWGCCLGANFGHASVIFDQLRNDTNAAITSTQQGWIASTVSFAMIPSNLLAGWLLEKLGRRSTAGLNEIINLLTWIITYFASSYEILLLGRLCGGIYIGLGYTTHSTYLGEIASPKLRASCISGLSLGVTFGVLLIQFLGNYLQWNTLALVFAIFPVYNLIVILYVRESYIWYINKNNIKRAKETFTWFKGKSQNCEEEFNKAIANVTQAQSYSMFGLITLFRKRSFLIPLAIISVSYMTLQLSGIHSVISYTSVILDAITKDANYQYFTTIAINIGRLLGVTLSLILVQKFSVKMVLLTTTFLLGALTLNQSLFLHLSAIYKENQVFVIISLVNLTLLVFIFSIGISPLATVVSGELYPGPIRGVAFSISATLSAMLLTVLLKITPTMLESLGMALTFLIFASFTLVGASILCLVLPNTKNKTLKEIELMYVKEKAQNKK